MRILAGYLPASAGTAKVAGFEVHDQSMAVRQHIGYLPETPPLYTDMTVEGFLHFVARIKGVSAGDRPRRVQTAINRCNLTEKSHTLIRKLSKGYRQRVGIAQAIVHDPPAIILDEPTVGLDPRQIAEVRSLIKSLAGDHTVILSTHILPEVSMTCDRIAIINKGRVVATNTPENLMAQLTGGAGYELEVEGDAADIQSRLVVFLQGLPNVKLVEKVAADLPERHKLRVIAEPGTALVGRDIAATVVSAGVGLYEMRRSQATLEDVFLELTTEEKPLDAATDADEGELSAGEAA
jgi:ABC-2 type transport system ATP-binding protein